MCGIWAILNGDSNNKYYDSFLKIENRGPDRSSYIKMNEFIKMYFGFHRLAIMDRSTKGDQPFMIEDDNRTIICLCNGEIYNYLDIINSTKIELNSGSDCETIPRLYIKYGFYNTIKMLQGEFVIILIDFDHINNIVKFYTARDPLGIRPLFYSENNKCIMFSSELKGINNITDPTTIKRFPPNHILEGFYNKNDSYKIKLNYYLYKYSDYTKQILSENITNNMNYIFELIRDQLETSVISMLQSDRPLGALLSGGLDSSLVVSIASYYLNRQNKKLKTFSIGMPNGTDEKYAKMVAEYCNTDHTHVEFSQDDFCNAIEDVIKTIESYDITTVRASTGQYLISKWISQHTDIKVLLIGDGSDELTCGYMYFHKAPSPIDAHNENIRLLEEIHIYDVLRADRGIAGNGLEARVPFLDPNFVQLYLSIPPALRIPKDGIEKWLLRKSFDVSDINIRETFKNKVEYLPKEVLYRKKEAFSDGVSGLQKSWYQIIQEKVETLYTDDYLEKCKSKYKINIPHTKEALYYREIYEKYYPNTDHLIPHYWLPKWCGNITEPSARVLQVYK